MQDIERGPTVCLSLVAIIEQSTAQPGLQMLVKGKSDFRMKKSPPNVYDSSPWARCSDFGSRSFGASSHVAAPGGCPQLVIEIHNRCTAILTVLALYIISPVWGFSLLDLSRNKNSLVKEKEGQ